SGFELGALQWFVDINWLYFCFLLFVLTCVVIFVVSAFTRKASDEQLQGLTYGTITREQKADVQSGASKWDYIHSGIVVAIVVSIYVYFW
ncbi:MAG TPA: Na+/glucose cotransporter, partial [Gammaproteobacteria bacterium]|nr:Na+/glucose cotransporter [Gammaproteobacteria bacterium]